MNWRVSWIVFYRKHKKLGLKNPKRWQLLLMYEGTLYKLDPRRVKIMVLADRLGYMDAKVALERELFQYEGRIPAWGLKWLKGISHIRKHGTVYLAYTKVFFSIKVFLECN